MQGRRFSRAISWARRCFLTVIGIVGAALDRRDRWQTITHSRPATRPMPVMSPAAGASSVVQAEGGELREFEERRAGIEQPLDPLARQQLAAREMARARGRAATLGSLCHTGAQLLDQRQHGGAVGGEFRALGVHGGVERRHVRSSAELANNGLIVGQ